MKLKKIVKKEELFFDKSYEISSTGGARHGVYTRLTLEDGFVWLNAKGEDVTNSRNWGKMLEKLYNSL